MSTNTAIDVIIPTFDRPDAVASLVDALGRQLAPQDRILVVWQASRPILAAHAQLAIVSSSPPNLPRARNNGIAAGKNPLVLFLDDDMEIEALLLEEHRRAYADSAIGCVAGFVDDPVYDHSRNTPSFFDEATGELVQDFTFPQSSFVISSPGGNVSYRRTALETIGGFDENYRGNALWEELDCAFRLRAAGYRIWYTSRARVRHLRLASGGCRHDRGAAYTYHQFANTAYFAARFAPRRHYASWIRAWKYRLEYLSRDRFLWLRHNPLLVIAAATGALCGIARYVRSGRRLAPQRGVFDYSRASAPQTG